MKIKYLEKLLRIRCFKKAYKEKKTIKDKRHGFNNEKGQIAIFLTIVFIGILFFCGILVDGARLVSARVQAVRALEDSCISTLALYNSQLKNEYGIFALSENNEDILKRTIEKYLNDNLSINDDIKGFDSTKDGQEYIIDLYDFRIEELKVTPFFNLTNNLIVKKQILEHMKYRAPKELGENILKKFNILKDIGEMASLYEKKTGLEKELGDLDALLREIKKNISGTLGDGIFEEEYIESFNLNGVRDKLIDTYVQLIEKQSRVLSYINEKKELLEQLYDLKEGAEIEGDIKQNNEQGSNTEQKSNRDDADLASKIQEAETEYFNAVNQLENIRVHISNTFEQLFCEHTEKYIDANEKTIAIIKKLMEAGKKLSKGINDLIGTVTSDSSGEKNETDKSGNYNEDNIGIEFKSILLEDLYNLKTLIPDYEKGNSMINVLENNIRALKSFMDIIEEVQHKVTDADALLNNDFSQIIDEIRKATEEINTQYKTVEFNYQTIGRGENEEDPRNDVANKVKNTLSELILKGLNIQEKEIDFSELPSRKKVDEPVFLDGDEKDEIHLNSPDVLQQSYSGEFHEIDKDIDLTNIDGVFTKKVLDFIANACRAIGTGLSDIRDELYISQYVINVFNNKVKKEMRTDKDGDNANEDDGYKTCFQAEVEYILHGDSLEQINVAKTAGKIALLRFGINTLQIYMDPVKREEAYSLATAIAGWWTGGAGIPIIANLIICTWGINDGVNDLKLLMDGKAVPLLKKSSIEFTYEDYLLFLLLLEDSEKKVDRIEDLIELNIRKNKKDFKMGNAHSAIRVEAEISMKYLFVTKNFMPAKLKTSDGRHRIKLLLYEEY